MSLVDRRPKRFAEHQRRLRALVGLLIALAGCSAAEDGHRGRPGGDLDDGADEGGGGNGGGGHHGGGGSDDPDPGSVSYPDRPSSLPDLDDLSAVALDASGGGGGSGNGGDGGAISLVALAGTLTTPAEGRADIDANYLTGALSDGLVTLDELTDVIVDSGTAYLELNGSDFWLPENTTLDLTGLAVTAVQIRVDGEGDAIRIDGEIGRANGVGNGVDLTLINSGAAGPAISIDGSIDLRGADGAWGGGDLAIVSRAGDIVVTGELLTTGGTGAAAGGAGGDLALQSDAGDIALPPGVLRASGGASDDADGGEGGAIDVAVENAEEAGFAWELDCSGGAGGEDGGDGGSFTLHFGGAVDVWLPYACDGGNSTDGNGGGGSGGGGDGGHIAVEAHELRGAMSGTSDGGEGGSGAAGGAAGSWQVGADYLWGAWLDLSANGGAGQSAGGSGDANNLFAGISLIANVRLELEAIGGDGADGGAGGTITGTFLSGNVVDTDVVARLSGGTGGAGGAGGDGGTVLLNSPTDPNAVGGPVEATTFEVTARGGAGVSGGSGGVLEAKLPAGAANALELTIDLDGGTATGSDPLEVGGNAGSATIQTQGPASVILHGSAAGGDGVTGGGQGGSVAITALRPLVLSQATSSLALDLSGGSVDGCPVVCLGSPGGSLTVTAADASVSIGELDVDLRGGSNDGGPGGQGGSLDLSARGNLAIAGGSFDCSGGSATGSSGRGGDSGDASLTTLAGNLDLELELRCNGGDGPGGGGDASPAFDGVRLSAAHRDELLLPVFGAGRIRVDGLIEVRGGAGREGATGGAGGYLSVDTQGDDASILTARDGTLGDDGPGGDIEWLATVDASGGASVLDAAAAAAGGAGGLIEFTSQGASLAVESDINANGGDGDPGGDGGAIWLNEGYFPSAEIFIDGVLSAFGGDGLVASGDPDAEESYLAGDGGYIALGIYPTTQEVGDLGGTDVVHGWGTGVDGQVDSGVTLSPPLACQTCSSESADCGTMPGGFDGCPSQFCGLCIEEACGGTVPNRCGGTSCDPITTCAEAGAACGDVSNGCGFTLDCGDCPRGQTCGGAGVANRCG